MICIILACSNQFCGINAIVFYAKQLFMRITDNNNNLSQISIILFGVVQILATLIGGKLMDKHSKKRFLLVGEIAMVLILGCIYLLNENTGMVVTLIFMHSIAYSFSIGQLLLFYAAKMLDNTGYVVMVNWFATFLVALFAEFMMKWLGIGKMCLVFCVILSICLMVLGKNLPSDQELLEK